MANSNTKKAAEGLGYWLQWQVPVCALIFILPTAIAIRHLRKRTADVVDPADLWASCWRNLHPRWLLIYRAFSFLAMALFLYQTVAAFGFFVFFFYTQWTFALVMLYFALATIVSMRGSLSQNGEKDKLIKKDYEEETTLEQQLGFLENLLQIVYQTCAGAVVLTDVVFWCLLLPFMTGEDFQLTLIIGCMHSVNAVFLIIETAFNRLPFTWFGIIYFILWSGVYVVFQWVLHACCFSWWPYPFLDLSTPLAPLWYLALALVHIPCYGLYVLLTKAKHASLSRMFPKAFVRVSIEKKRI